MKNQDIKEVIRMQVQTKSDDELTKEYMESARILDTIGQTNYKRLPLGAQSSILCALIDETAFRNGVSSIELAALILEQVTDVNEEEGSLMVSIF